MLTLLDLCVSSLRRGHANILCVAPILTDDPRRESTDIEHLINTHGEHVCMFHVCSYVVLLCLCFMCLLFVVLCLSTRMMNMSDPLVRLLRAGVPVHVAAAVDLAEAEADRVA